MSNTIISSNSNFPISINKLQQKSSMSISSILNIYLKIIQTILAHFSKIKCPSTIFDINKQNNIDTDSDSENNENNSIIEKLDIENFIIRCIELLDINEEILILSMMALDKLLAKKFFLCENNLHKVIFICIMETHKYYNDDFFISNNDYSKVSGIPTDELLNMELEFMNIIYFNMYINEEDYDNYCIKIKKYWKNILF